MHHTHVQILAKKHGQGHRHDLEILTYDFQSRTWRHGGTHRFKLFTIVHLYLCFCTVYLLIESIRSLTLILVGKNF